MDYVYPFAFVFGAGTHCLQLRCSISYGPNYQLNFYGGGTYLIAQEVIGGGEGALGDSNTFTPYVMSQDLGKPILVNPSPAIEDKDDVAFHSWNEPTDCDLVVVEPHIGSCVIQEK